MTTTALERLVKALEARAAAQWLAPGADEDQLSQAEAALGLKLPQALRELYRCHDGERLPRGVLEGVFSRVRFLSLEEVCAVVEERRRRPRTPLDADVKGPVEAVAWSTGWLPFARDFGDNLLAVDCSPPAAGVEGQVVSLGFDDGCLEVLAPSLKAFLEDEAAALESGARVVAAAPSGREVTVRLMGVSQWNVGQPVQAPAHGVSVKVIAPEQTGRAARAMTSGLCVVVSCGGAPLSFSGLPRLVSARLLDGSDEVSLGLGTAQVLHEGTLVTCVLLPVPKLEPTTAMELRVLLAPD